MAEVSARTQVPAAICMIRAERSRFFASSATAQRDPVLAARPSVLYLVEVTDWDTGATVFHKVGIGTLDAISRPCGGGCDRLYRHYREGARLISSAKTDLLTSLTAEQAILRRAAQPWMSESDQNRPTGQPNRSVTTGEPGRKRTRTQNADLARPRADWTSLSSYVQNEQFCVPSSSSGRAPSSRYERTT